MWWLGGGRYIQSGGTIHGVTIPQPIIYEAKGISFSPPDFDPVLTVVGTHEGFQFIPPLVAGRTFVDLLGDSLQQTNRDVPVEKTKPLQ